MAVMQRKKGFFSISAVAQMFSVHQQTIRLYEKEGLISPKRSEGNTRLFSEEDVNRLEEIIHLTHNLGINLAGVEMILKLKKQIKKMQKDMNKLFDETSDQLDQQTELSKEDAREAMKKLMALKGASQPQPSDQLNSIIPHPKQEDPEIIDAENWDIEYDDE
jgi:MerR family transcriptional regulator, heat shock protein HspR